jgi:hypothetical protein
LQKELKTLNEQIKKAQDDLSDNAQVAKLEKLVQWCENECEQQHEIYTRQNFIKIDLFTFNILLL